MITGKIPCNLWCFLLVEEFWGELGEWIWVWISWNWLVLMFCFQIKSQPRLGLLSCTDISTFPGNPISFTLKSFWTYHLVNLSTLTWQQAMVCSHHRVEGCFRQSGRYYRWPQVSWWDFSVLEVWQLHPPGGIIPMSLTVLAWCSLICCPLGLPSIPFLQGRILTRYWNTTLSTEAHHRNFPNDFHLSQEINAINLP